SGGDLQFYNDYFNRLAMSINGTTNDVGLAGNIWKAGTLFLHNVGNANTGVGLGALTPNTGESNTAVGDSALSTNTTGSFNTAVGKNAGLGYDISSIGSNNTFIGYQAGPGTSYELYNAAAIGANARVQANNAMVLGDDSVNVGIGTQAPSYKL